MKTREMYVLNVSDFDKFVIRRTKFFFIFLVFNHECKMKIDRVLQANKLFFYITKENNKPINVIGDINQRWEFQLSSSFDLVETYKKQNLKTPKEERAMFTNFKITEVEFREVNEVALETAIEKVADRMDDVEIKTKGNKSFLVKDGSAIEINGAEFVNLIKKYVIGKTEAELTRNSSMYQLIKSLGIIKSAKVEADESDLSSIFG